MPPFREIIPLPCGLYAGIISYYPGSPGRLSGTPEVCYPPEPPEIEWELCDANGNLLPELSSGQMELLEQELLRIIADSRQESLDEARIDAYRDAHDLW